MSLMISEVYDALVAAGAPEEKAKAAAAAIPIVENLATKDDIEGIRKDLTAFKLASKEDIGAVRRDLMAFNLASKEDIGVVRQDLTALILATKDDVEVLRRDLALLKLAVFSFAPAVLALLGKLVFFP